MMTDKSQTPCLICGMMTQPPPDGWGYPDRRYNLSRRLEHSKMGAAVAVAMCRECHDKISNRANNNDGESTESEQVCEVIVLP